MSRTLDLDLAAPDLTGVDLPTDRRLRVARLKSRLAAGVELAYVVWLLGLFGLSLLGIEVIPEPQLTIADVAFALVRLVLFLVWVYEAYRIAGMLSRYPLHSTPGWAVGVFFLPIVNLWMPYQRLREIDETSHPETVAFEDEGRDDRLLLGLWWGAWVFSTIGTQLVNRLEIEALPIVLGSGFAVIGAAITSAFVAVRLHDAQVAYTDRLYDATLAAEDAPEASGERADGWGQDQRATRRGRMD